jgi:hypothetical protein
MREEARQRKEEQVKQAEWNVIETAR